MESNLGLESIDKQLRRWWEGRENNSLGSVWSFFPFDPVCPNISLFLSTRFCSFLVNCRSLCSVLCFLDVFFICLLDRGLGLPDNCWGPSFSCMWRSEIFWWSSLHLFRLFHCDFGLVAARATLSVPCVDESLIRQAAFFLTFSLWHQFLDLIPVL